MHDNKKLRSESSSSEGASSPTALKKGTWAEDEHERLVQAVEQFGTDGTLAWQSIQQFVGTRDIKQLKDRYKLKLDESFISSEWTKHEDTILLSGVEFHGQKWTRIAQELPGRNENSIKTRYHTLQRRELKIWTADEENLLRNLLERQVSFEDICQCFPKKTPNMIATKRDNFAMELTAQSIMEQMRATSADDFHSALLQPFSSSTLASDEAVVAVAAADAAAAIIPLADTAVTVAPAPPVFPAPESPSSRRFSFSRRTSEKLDSTFSPLHFPEPHLIAAHAGGDGLDLSPLDESFMSMLQKIAREGQDYAPVHHPHHQPPLVYQPPPPLAYQPPPLICPPQPQYSAPPAGEPAQFSSPPSSRTYSTTADELLASPALFRQQLEFD